MTRVVVAGYARSPFTLARKGALARVRPDDLAAQVVRGLVERSGVNPDDIEDLLLGCAFPEGEQGLNLARLVGLMAGLPRSVGGATINRFCGSSMSSVHVAAGSIALGAGEVFVCAGVESMSRVPMMGFNPMPHPDYAKTNPEFYIGMGDTAENVRDVLRILEISQLGDVVAADLSQGQRQLVAVARVLAGQPEVALLDEPAAGLDSTESRWLGERLRAARSHGVSMVLVDHDMDLVLSLCDRVIVLDLGSVIAEGTPDEIRRSPAVVNAYLGTPSSAVAGTDEAEDSSTLNGAVSESHSPTKEMTP